MPLAVFPKCFLDQMCVTREMTVDQWLDLALTLDVDGYEFYWGFTPWQDEKALDRIRNRVASEKRSIPMMCFSPDFTQPTREARAGEVVRQKQAIAATAALGGTYCRVLSGQRRPDISIQQGITWVRDCIHEVLPFAAEHDVTLILENHYKDGYWSFPEFAQRAEVFLQLVDAIGSHTHFGINFDPSNALVAGDDPVELLGAVVDQVVTMHASDRYLEGGTLDALNELEQDPHQGYAPFLKHGVIGEGLNNYDALFALLKAAKFDGWISIENGQDPLKGMDHLQRSAKFLRKKMAQYDLA